MVSSRLLIYMHMKYDTVNWDNMSKIYYLVFVLICFGCNTKTTIEDENISSIPLTNIELNDCVDLDENKIFNDKKGSVSFCVSGESKSLP